MRRALVIILAVLSFSTLVAAQRLPEPILQSSSLPMYPPIAREAKVTGTVRIAFVLNESGEVTEVKNTSGHPMLTASAIGVVKAWRFRMPKDLYRTEWSYETEFVYQFSGHEVGSYDRPKVTVSFTNFHRFEITTDTVKPVVLP